MGAGRMCRGHQQQSLDEGKRVSPGLPVQISTVFCVFGGWCPYLCVLEGSGSVCHCLCLLRSYQLFLCVWGCLYCRAVAACDAVTGCI